MLRTRQSRREDPLEAQAPDPAVGPEDGHDPEEEALLADSVGVALLVVLDTLTPAERLAFVLHDMFSVPFDEIGPMIERSPPAARQLASRARRRVKEGAAVPDPDLTCRRQVVEAFLAATRGGDFEALVALLHPDVVLRADRAVGPTLEPIVVLGAHRVATGAMAAAGRARFTGLALVDGTVGLAMAPHGRLFLVLSFAITEGKIAEIDVIADRDHLGRLGFEPGNPSAGWHRADLGGAWNRTVSAYVRVRGAVRFHARSAGRAEGGRHDAQVPRHHIRRQRGPPSTKSGRPVASPSASEVQNCPSGQSSQAFFLNCPAIESSRTLGEADRPGVAAQAVVRDPPDFSDLATVVSVLAGEPVEALRVGEILHGQRCSDDEVLVNDCVLRGTVRTGRAMMHFR